MAQAPEDPIDRLTQLRRERHQAHTQDRSSLGTGKIVGLALLGAMLLAGAFYLTQPCSMAKLRILAKAKSVDSTKMKTEHPVCVEKDGRCNCMWEAIDHCDFSYWTGSGSSTVSAGTVQSDCHDMF